MSAYLLKQKQKLMIKFAKILFVMLCFTHVSAFGQELKKETLTTDWNLLSETNGIKIFLRTETCQVQGAPKPFDYAFIKLENSNSVAKTIDFQLGLNYTGTCIGCSENDSEAKRNIVIPANSVLIGDATFEKGELSYLIANHNSPAKLELKSIKLINLNIQ